VSAVRVDRDKDVPLIVIDRPEAANALSLEVLEELEAVIDQLEGDRGTRCVVLTRGRRPYLFRGRRYRSDARPVSRRRPSLRW
jgi:enoyl-CoA hydratase/carnithine racemase